MLRLTATREGQRCAPLCGWSHMVFLGLWIRMARVQGMWESVLGWVRVRLGPLLPPPNRIMGPLQGQSPDKCAPHFDGNQQKSNRSGQKMAVPLLPEGGTHKCTRASIGGFTCKLGPLILPIRPNGPIPCRESPKKKASVHTMRGMFR